MLVLRVPDAVGTGVRGSAAALAPDAPDAVGTGVRGSAAPGAPDLPEPAPKELVVLLLELLVLVVDASGSAVWTDFGR